MQWFKHSKNFRSTAAMRYIEAALGEAGYARALKLLEIFCETCPRKPFTPRIEIKPPFTWRWLALEMGCTEDEAVRTIEILGEANFIEIPEKVIIQRSGKGKPEIRRPSVITCDAMLEKVEWHDLSNRNKKRLEKEDAPLPEDSMFVAAVQAPGDDAAANQRPRITRIRE